jgi:hypothetical protein
MRIETALPAGYGARGLSSPVPYKDRAPGQIKRKAEAEADPERRLRLLERAHEGHSRTLRTLVEHLTSGGYTVDEQLDGYDLCARRHQPEPASLFEVKTWTPKSLSRQVRHGWAQLLEYRYRNQERLPDETRLYLVLDREPPLDFWAWKYLVEKHNVLVCWILDNQLATLPQYKQLLPGV